MIVLVKWDGVLTGHNRGYCPAGRENRNVFLAKRKNFKNFWNKMTRMSILFTLRRSLNRQKSIFPQIVQYIKR